jgi:hypothetical protein
VEVANMVRAQPRLLPHLIELLWDGEPGLAMRASDVLERVTHGEDPAVERGLQRRKDELLGLLAEAALNKLRWNLAFTVPRLSLTALEVRRAAQVLQTYLEDKSSIVKTAALRGLTDLTR